MNLQRSAEGFKTTTMAEEEGVQGGGEEGVSKPSSSVPSSSINDDEVVLPPLAWPEEEDGEGGGDAPSPPLSMEWVKLLGRRLLWGTRRKKAREFREVVPETTVHLLLEMAHTQLKKVRGGRGEREVLFVFTSWFCSY